jgi:DNA-binding XRE family transcriptional regulator
MGNEMGTTIREHNLDHREAALTMAIAVFAERIRGLSKEDKDDLFELSKALFGAESKEDFDAAVAGYREILEQPRISGSRLGVSSDSEESERIRIRNWLEYVSARIREARKEANMTQDALGKATGLPQSHISRLEAGLHSPSHLTLKRIAEATGRELTFFDPSASDDCSP